MQPHGVRGPQGRLEARPTHSQTASKDVHEFALRENTICLTATTKLLVPSEELNLIVEGADYEWPYCYNTNEVDKVTNAPEERCAKRMRHLAGARVSLNRSVRIAKRGILSCTLRS